jgi:hypothetical protein
MVILSVCFSDTIIVIRSTGSSVTWTPPLIKRELVRRGRSEHVQRQSTHHVVLCSTVLTFVLKPSLTAVRFCDGIKGGTLSLLYSLLLQLDNLYSEPINVKPDLALDENIRRKVHEVFMHRWSVFHAPIHSAAFAMNR